MGTSLDTHQLGRCQRISSWGVVCEGRVTDGQTADDALFWLSARGPGDADWLTRAEHFIGAPRLGLLVGFDAGFLDLDDDSWSVLRDGHDVLGGRSVRCLVSGAPYGSPLDDVVTQDLDPRLVLAGLSSIASALDDIHRDPSAPRQAHGNVQPSNVFVTTEGGVVLAVPPADLWLDDPTPAYRAPELSSPSEQTPAGDRFSFSGVVERSLTGADPSVGTISMPGACVVDATSRPTSLLEWTSRITGDTIAPGTLLAATVTSEADVNHTTTSEERSMRRPVILIGLPLILGVGLGWLLASIGGADGSAQPVGAHDCDPVAVSDEAEQFLGESGTEFAWTDSDQDCHHDAYEIHWLGTDYRVPDGEVNGERASAEMQMRVLVNYFEDLSVVRDVNPGKCEPERIAAAAGRYIERAQLEVTWVDTDDDCLHDIWESNAMGSDPGDPDTDGDGVIDSLDPKQGSGALLVPVDEQLLFIQDVHGRNHFDASAVEGTDPSLCSPAAWARAAELFVALAYSTPEWVDPDGDCVHSVYEADVLSTDPDNPDSDGDGLLDGNDPDNGDGMIPPIDRQYDYVITVAE